MNNILMKIGFLKPKTTTVCSGEHFEQVKRLMDEFTNEEWSVSIHCNKWLLTEMLKLENSWDDNAKQIYTLLHNQLTQNIKSNKEY